MGLTFIHGEVKNKGKQTQKVRFLVDSGATYSVLPYAVWKALALKPKRTMEFTLADGSGIKRDVSECFLSIEQGQAHTPVILGVEDDTALLGAVTLEIFGLVLNPFNRKLQEIRAMMA